MTERRGEVEKSRRTPRAGLGRKRLDVRHASRSSRHHHGRFVPRSPGIPHPPRPSGANQRVAQGAARPCGRALGDAGRCTRRIMRPHAHNRWSASRQHSIPPPPRPLRARRPRRRFEIASRIGRGDGLRPSIHRASWHPRTQGSLEDSQRPGLPAGSPQSGRGGRGMFHDRLAIGPLWCPDARDPPRVSTPATQGSLENSQRSGLLAGSPQSGR
ncbi:MAG: hypothetical protein RL689_545 [Planctomycetota bacterium]